MIVSGLARGIDTAAHTGALAASKTGSTIAVLAGGIDVIYPKENATLYQQIAEGGCIVAESSMGAPARAHDFPRRNRIISGLCERLVVVEATVKSGSLISADRASDQGREVMAVPGFPLDPRAKGPNKLLKAGATLVETSEDIMHALNYLQMNKDDLFREDETSYITALPSEAEYDRVERRLLDSLGHYPTSIDTLITHVEASAHVVQSTLMMLEIAGRVQRHMGNKYSLILNQ